MADFNLPDGSVSVFVDDETVVFYEGIEANTWFFAPRAAKVTQDASGRPIFGMIRHRKILPGGAGVETTGGITGFQLELNVPMNAHEWSQQLTAHTGISPIGAARFNFRPMRLRDGRMTIHNIEQYVDNPAAYQNMPAPASGTVPISLQLNKTGADVIAAALQNPQLNLPIIVGFEYKFDYVIPAGHLKITADLEKVYDYFSADVKARVSVWFASASANWSTEREKLKTSGAVKIERIDGPAAGSEAMKKLEDTVIDTWVKGALQQMVEKPTPDPAVAPNPGGWFGGVSVALKSKSQVISLNLDVEYVLSTIHESSLEMSYVVQALLAGLNPADFLTDISDDSKLPIQLNLGADPRIVRYSSSFGYRKASGEIISNNLPSSPGDVPALLDGILQVAQHEVIPNEIDFSVSVDWVDISWEDRVFKFTEAGNEDGVTVTFSPGNFIADVRIISNFEFATEGSISTLNYKTSMPDMNGQPVKVYSGGAFYLGKGNAGELQELNFSFPYNRNDIHNSFVEWDYVVNLPNGTSETKSGRQPISQTVFAVVKPATA